VIEKMDNYKRKSLTPLTIAVTTVCTAFVCVATIMFSVYVPSTQGFFNMGESMVFLSALLFGQFVGAFAGGVGSMLADLLLGYPHYAPATLIVKACEGYAVGFLINKSPNFKSDRQWKFFTSILGIVAGGILVTVGSIYYSGLIEVTIGFTPYSFLLPVWFWMVLGVIVAFFIALIGFKFESKLGWSVFSVIIGGSIMVLGYFIYQMFFIGWLFNIQAVALAEIPINIGQMIVGSIIALPTSKIVTRILPQLKQTQQSKDK
jgi:uncharacterized membrane protein